MGHFGVDSILDYLWRPYGRFWGKNRIPNVAKHQMIWQFAGACSSCATGPRQSIPYMPLDLEVARLYCPKEMDLRRALQAMKLKVFLKMAPSRSFFFSL